MPQKKKKVLIGAVVAVVLCLGAVVLIRSFLPGGEEKEVVLEWFVNSTNSAQSYPARDTLVEQIIYEKTGVRVNMTFAASEDGSQLANMIAGDSMADIITFGPDLTSGPLGLMNQMVEEGMLYSWQELDKLNPGLLDACRPDVVGWWSSPDGNLYGYPNSCTNEQDLEDNPYAEQPLSVIIIRKDMWEQLGSPDMSTPAAFLEACKRAEEEIGQYNGYDIIGFQCKAGVVKSIADVSPYFSVPFENEDGTYSFSWDQPTFKECLAFFNEAYRTGLLRESNFSDTEEIVEEHVAQGRVFALVCNGVQYRNGMYKAYEADNSITYVCPVLGNSQGQPPTLSASTSRGSMPTVVPKSTKYAKEIAKLLTYLISDEGQLLLYLGVEGETFHYNEQGKAERDFVVADAAEYGLNTMWPLRNVTYFQSIFNFSYDEVPGYIVKWPLNEYTYDLSVVLKEDPADERANDIAELRNRIDNYTVSAYGQIITASTEEEFNARYDAMLQELDKMGLDTLREYDNECLQRAKESLGVEHIWPHY